MAMGSSSRGGATVRLIGIHTAEGARTAGDLKAYFERTQTGSSHAIIDASTTLDNQVPYSRAAWTLRSGNPISDNVELCGFAKWSRAQWLSPETVDGCRNPRAMVDRCAIWVRARSKARGIPIRRLTHAQIRSGAAGVIAHDDWTKAMQDGSHWDPGPNFPWDYMLAKARGEDDGMSATGPEKWDAKDWTKFWDAQVPLSGASKAALGGKASISFKGLLGYAASNLFANPEVLAKLAPLLDDESQIIAAVKDINPDLDPGEMEDAFFQALLRFAGVQPPT